LSRSQKPRRSADSAATIFPVVFFHSRCSRRPLPRKLQGGPDLNKERERRDLESEERLSILVSPSMVRGPYRRAGAGVSADTRSRAVRRTAINWSTCSV